MLRWIPASLLVLLLAAAWVGGTDVAAGGDASQLASLPFSGSTNHPAIEYATRPSQDAVAMLNVSLAAGHSELEFTSSAGYLRPLVDSVFGTGGPGYLPALLDALKIPRESQLMVFSKTGVQSRFTGPTLG